MEITIEEEQEKVDIKDNIIEVQTQNDGNNNTTVNTTTDTTEDSDTVSGIIGLGLIGGGCYWGYKKFKGLKK